MKSFVPPCYIFFFSISRARVGPSPLKNERETPTSLNFTHSPLKLHSSSPTTLCLVRSFLNSSMDESSLQFVSEIGRHLAQRNRPNKDFIVKSLRVRRFNFFVTCTNYIDVCDFWCLQMNFECVELGCN